MVGELVVRGWWEQAGLELVVRRKAVGPTDALEAEAEAKDQRDKAEMGNEMEIESDGDKYNLSNIGTETSVPV